MKKSIRQLNTLIASAVLCFSFSFPVFAESTVKYSNELTVTPIRVFFAILVVILFVISEIAFEKIREKRVEKRNKKYGKDKE
ncbi:MAG: hypothetical protein IJ031_01290 [Oscillospiraceae bacterium]|nr:hypothetical protein [Clostridia bacterium]MBQ8883218.1 hypothetical protein [Oscillospiraceae bacterium]